MVKAIMDITASTVITSHTIFNFFRYFDIMLFYEIIVYYGIIFHFKANMLTRIKKSFLINITLFLIAIMVAYGAGKLVDQAIAMREEEDSARQKVEELKQQRDKLEAQIAEYNTKEAVERDAKSRRNLKMIGEKVVVVPESRRSDSNTKNSVGFWSTIGNFFKKHLNPF